MKNLLFIIHQKLGLLEEYCSPSHIDDVAITFINGKWIRNIIHDEKYWPMPQHEILSPGEVQSALQLDDSIGEFWEKALIQVLPKKNEEVFLLHHPVSNFFTKNTYSQILHYVSESNAKNLWKESFKRYFDHTVTLEWKEEPKNDLDKHSNVLRQSLLRLYQCPIISLRDDINIDNNLERNVQAHQVHPNIHPALCVLEADSHFFIIFQPSAFSVYECVHFSPAKFHDNETGALFVLFQLLEVIRDTQERGLFLGNINLYSLRLVSSLHLTVIPDLRYSLLTPTPSNLSNEEIHEISNSSTICTTSLDECCFDVISNNLEKSTNESLGFLSYITSETAKNILSQIENNRNVLESSRLEKHYQSSLIQLTQLWVLHELTNLDYLLCLSYFSGHSFDSPIYHPTLPWVIDFNGNWRDLSKSKYRLQKGDAQLDHMYEITDSSHKDHIPHHIPEFFSEVTFYVYKARITPKCLLQKHVRNQFVPSHYPSNMSRMYAWSPEECIPDFYLNPAIFKSIHNDLPDLEIPSWCRDVNGFLQFHRDALESHNVSRRLHHWIDLYYGYKLSGGAAIKAKNVCLSLVDAHSHLVKGGIVQLFNIPHPQKLTPSPYLSKTMPIAVKCNSKDFNNKDGQRSETTAESKSLEGTAEGVKSPPAPKGRVKQEEKRPLILPQNYNPLTALNQIEMLFNFSLKTTGKIPKNLNKVRSDSLSSEQAFEWRCVRDMQVLGCLIVELFAASRCRIVNPRANLRERYAHAMKIMKYDLSSIPRCLRPVLKNLFQIENGSSNNWSLPVTFKPVVTRTGLPPPNPYQLLHPFIQTLPFPPEFDSVFSFIKSIKEYSNLCEEAVYINDSLKKEQFYLKTADLQVKIAVNQFNNLVPLLNESLKLLLPYILDLMQKSITSISIIWHLFEPLSQALGPLDSEKYLLSPLVHLFERELISHKQIKLFHRNFLLQLIIRFGLECFLKHFTVSLIQGVSGRKECLPRGISVREDIDKDSTMMRSASSNVTLCETLPVSPCDEDSFSISNSESHRQSSSIKSPSAAEADITDAETETEMFIFDGGEDDDDTIEDIQVESVSNMNSQLRSPDILEEDNFENVSLHETDMSHSPSHCPYSPRGEENEDGLKTDNSDRNVSPGIPIPKLKPASSSSNLYSTSLPDKPQTLSPFSKMAENTPASGEITRKASIEVSDGDISIVDVCCGSVLWLSHRLGPVLTARYLTTNLLKTLPMCYLTNSDAFTPLPVDSKDKTSVTRKRILGDKNSSKIVYCLSEIAGVYGEQMILQYLSRITELIKWCEGRLTNQQEAGLIGGMVLLQHIILQLSDITFMEQLQETLIRSTVYPVIRLLSSRKVFFPNGAQARSALAWRVVDCLFLMALRMGREMSKKKLTSTITRFLTAFDRVYSPSSRQNTSSNLSEESANDNSSKSNSDPHSDKEKILEELKQVFTPELAYLSYPPMCLFFSTKYMEEHVPNVDLVRSLSLQFDENNQSHYAAVLTADGLTGESLDPSEANKKSQNENANVALTGNRIDIKVPNESLNLSRDELLSSIDFAASVDITKYTNSNMENTQRHLRGNWFAYWEHEIGRSDIQEGFNFKQIKLQSFIGHSSTVKSICFLDNENSFMSSSRDKSVKLWSLRSQGDGNAQVNCHWTYSNHKKSVSDVVFSESMRVAASSDSTVHIWDPFICTCIKQLDSIKYSPVLVLKAMPAPSSQLIGVTIDSSLKLIDIRTCSYTNELKVSMNSLGLVRAITVSDDSNYVAVAHSSGIVATLDLRTGHLLHTMRVHEGEIKDLLWFEKGTFISSGIDQSIMVWNILDETKYVLRGPPEPIHCLRKYGQELIIGTTSNRIGVYSSLSASSNFSCSKLRSDVFKGNLTSMALLPLNRQLLLGSDNGNILLTC